jgi:hypothetical protein
MRIINLVVRKTERVENVEFVKTIIHCLPLPSPFLSIGKIRFVCATKAQGSLSSVLSPPLYIVPYFWIYLIENRTQ